eukprot:Filipodium_phascolosomae@DN2262_c0_g1_i1.p1
MVDNFKLWSVSTRAETSTTSTGLHPLVEKYTANDDYELDKEIFIRYDLKATKAHAQMLAKIGILEADELNKALVTLNEMEELFVTKELELDPGLEDCHSAIELYLTRNAGDIGKKIHTGRSRNDQALVMIRLYMKDGLKELINLTDQVIKALRLRSWNGSETSGIKLSAEELAKLQEQNIDETDSSVPMPGYTHMQRAMPSTVGQWFKSYHEAFQDCIPLLQSVLNLVDQNPLGSAAGFGIKHLKLDREETTDLLGFKRVQSEPMYCGMSRGLFEGVVLSQCLYVMQLCGKFAADMMMFTQQETGFFSLPDQYVTGSSIMPQKKNYDLFEIMRGNVRIVSSRQQECVHISSGLGSGYHRDLQLTKKSLVEGVEITRKTLQLLEAVLPKIQV